MKILALIAIGISTLMITGCTVSFLDQLPTADYPALPSIAITELNEREKMVAVHISAQIVENLGVHLLDINGLLNEDLCFDRIKSRKRLDEISASLNQDVAQIQAIVLPSKLLTWKRTLLLPALQRITYCTANLSSAYRQEDIREIAKCFVMLEECGYYIASAGQTLVDAVKNPSHTAQTNTLVSLGDIAATKEDIKWVSDQSKHFEQFEKRGSGSSRVMLPLQTEGALFLVSATNSNSTKFKIELVNEEDKTYSTLFSTTGMYSGTRLSSGGRQLQITSQGEWKITAAPLTDANWTSSPMSGTGDTVFILPGSMSDVELHVTHESEELFQLSMSDSLFFERRGPFEHVVIVPLARDVNHRPEIIQVRASGKWTIR